MEDDRYAAVIEACALKTDLAIFDAGDETGRLTAVLRWWLSEKADPAPRPQRSARRASRSLEDKKLE